MAATAPNDNELVSISPARTASGIPIPAPKDPVLAAQWRAGVAARRAAGLGTQVGDYE